MANALKFSSGDWVEALKALYVFPPGWAIAVRENPAMSCREFVLQFGFVRAEYSHTLTMTDRELAEDYEGTMDRVTQWVLEATGATPRSIAPPRSLPQHVTVTELLRCPACGRTNDTAPWDAKCEPWHTAGFIDVGGPAGVIDVGGPVPVPASGKTRMIVLDDE